MGNRNSGRRPKPTALKVLRGNPGQRKLNEAEPIPPAGEVTIPRLSETAKVIWAELAPVATAMGTLTRADGKAFATLCELQATLDAACAEKDREGFSPFLVTTMVDSAGNEHANVKEHPAIKLERNTAAALRPYYEKFGLEPVGRARISVPKAQEPVNKWAAMGLA
jgi:P27 family predicted phage terminase small subunit